jgi:serine/threonine-protein kinase
MTDPIGPIRAAVAGRYEIQREIGQGAFATVYLARDLRHDRYVAFKILNADPNSEIGELRFLREIHLLARLQHPNILPLIDSGHAEAMLYYVMPYVKGETLRERMRREGQLALDAALTITRDAADALSCAHEQGIIHRDMKPENILLSAGRSIIADFGIARAIDLAGVRQLTRTGIGSPGTPAYMSPEQLMGDKEVDPRTDIYSLGCVLYEMLTGKPPFAGKDGFVKRFTEPPPLPSTSRKQLPPRFDALITKSLARDPSDRYETAAEFGHALAGAQLAAPQSASAPSADAMSENALRPESSKAVESAGGLSERTGPRSLELTQDASGRHLLSYRTKWRVVAILGAMAAIVAVVLAWSASRRAVTQDGVPVRRWEIVLPDSAPLAFVGVASLGIGSTALALSPDGSRLVYVARSGATTQLYHRELDKLGATRLPGTDGAYYPFFSPDGRWVGFFADAYLKKVSIPEGQVITLTRVNGPMGGAWSSDGRILVADNEGTKPGWVSDGGGVFHPILLPGAVSRQWRFPQLLPGGDWALHTDWDGSLALSSVRSGQAYGITTDGVTRRDSTDVSTLLFGTNPLYVSSGHILYLSGVGGILMALPFDAANRRVLGPPTPVLAGIRQEAEAGAGQLALARDGTLVYAPGTDAGVSQLVWIDQRGKIDTLPFPRAGYGSFNLSPDGKRILIRVQSASGRGELWVLDIDKGSQTRIPTIGTPLYAHWWPDNTRILFSEFTAAGGLSAPLILQSPEDPSRRDTLVSDAVGAMPSPDGRRLAVTRWQGRSGLWVIPVDSGNARPAQVVQEDVFFQSFSPDGRWIVYMVPDPSAIVVINLEHPQERHRISTAGGEEPIWSPRGDRIIYRNNQQWLAVDVSTNNGFHASRPRVLFEGPYLNVPGWSHDITPDGQRHLLLLGPREQTSNRLVVVTNWFAELKRLAPPGMK